VIKIKGKYLTSNHYPIDSFWRPAQKKMASAPPGSGAGEDTTQSRDLYRLLRTM